MMLPITISEISDRLNYSSIQHFSYAFKQYYGDLAKQLTGRRLMIPGLIGSREN